MTRPKIAADVASALTAAIPLRLIKKLDAEPTLAEAWTWDATSVTTDKGEIVRFTLSDDVVTAVACSCLLQPKCLHIAAVVALLEPAAADSLTARSTSASDGQHAEHTVVSSTSSAGSDAARQAFRVLADVLATGAEASGALAQAELLRSIHTCRSVGLHRLATSQTRALRSIRDLRADRPEFVLAVLTADLRNALVVAHELAAGSTSPALFGTARRDYESIGNIRLRGVFTEAVVARSGYAGAVTYLFDDKGTLYTRSDVAPGDAGRAAGDYDAPAGIGDAVLPHRELCRTGLFVSDATASADGRLGAGQKVRAVRASEPTRWDREPLDVRFRVPLADQLAQIAARDAIPDELRPPGWDLVFVEGTVVGGASAVGIVVGEVPLLVSTSLVHPALATRDNLIILSRAPGLRVRAIGRARIGAPREISLLAIGPADGETRFPMPEAWHGRANIHFDRLSTISTGEAAAAVQVAPPSPHDDLLAPLRRRVERAVLGGVVTLPTHAIAELDREAAALSERALRGGAEVLRDLAAIAHDAARTASGARRALDRTAFAQAWLRAALYDDAARRRLAVASW